MPNTYGVVYGGESILILILDLNPRSGPARTRVGTFVNVLDRPRLPCCLFAASVPFAVPGIELRARRRQKRSEKMEGCVFRYRREHAKNVSHIVYCWTFAGLDGDDCLALADDMDQERQERERATKGTKRDQERGSTRLDPRLAEDALLIRFVPCCHRPNLRKVHDGEFSVSGRCSLPNCHQPCPCFSVPWPPELRRFTATGSCTIEGESEETCSIQKN